MFKIYVLKSLKNGKHYIGYTGKDLLERLHEHNRRTNIWTRQNGPFQLIYSEQCETKTAAIKREHFLKTGYGRKQLKELLEGKQEGL